MKLRRVAYASGIDRAYTGWKDSHYVRTQPHMHWKAQMRNNSDVCAAGRRADGHVQAAAAVQWPLRASGGSVGRGCSSSAVAPPEGGAGGASWCASLATICCVLVSPQQGESRCGQAAAHTQAVHGKHALDNGCVARRFSNEMNDVGSLAC